MKIKLTGIADEAGSGLETQIKATQALGWDSIEFRAVEVPGFPKGNIHDIPDAAFDLLSETLEKTGLHVSAFGSTIANWAESVLDPFEISLEKVERAIPRMQRLGTKFVRIMSYAILKNPDGTDAANQEAQERFRRLREITTRFSDAGIVTVHENCMNYGGMSIPHALETLEHVPGLKWVFDTGNPVFNEDRAHPGQRQNSWEFYQAVKPHIAHVHVKDGRWNPTKNDADYTFPGEGEGHTERILSDLLASGYQGYISIEPHVSVVFHDADTQSAISPEEKAKEQFDSYVKYGKQLESIIENIQKRLLEQESAL